MALDAQQSAREFARGLLEAPQEIEAAVAQALAAKKKADEALVRERSAQKERASELEHRVSLELTKRGIYAPQLQQVEEELRKIQAQRRSAGTQDKESVEAQLITIEERMAQISRTLEKDFGVQRETVDSSLDELKPARTSGRLAAKEAKLAAKAASLEGDVADMGQALARADFSIEAEEQKQGEAAERERQSRQLAAQVNPLLERLGLIKIAEGADIKALVQAVRIRTG